MTARAKRTPLFGAFLAACRGPKRTPRAVAQQLRAQGYVLDQSSIWKFEAGQVPKFDSLAALAVAYRLDFTALCARLGAELLGTALPALAAPSEDALALADAFDSWDREKQDAFLRIAGVPRVREGRPRLTAPPRGPQAATRGSRP